MLKTKYKRIHFKNVSNLAEFSKRKTKVYYCYANADPCINKIRLGTIKWYSQWRQYCFFPHHDRWTMLIFSGGCSTDIGHFCKQLMQQRTDNRAVAKAIDLARKD